MENKNLQNPEEENNEHETKIYRNDDVNEHDSTVVVEEEDRTVILREDETVIIEKEEKYDIAPKNRPRKPYAGMWGIPEMATVALATLAVLSVLMIYLFFVLPEKSLLDQNRVKRDRLEEDLIAARKKFGNMTDTETQVSKLITSAEDFETRFLKPELSGKSAIYQRINGLINAYGLVNTNGPDYQPLEISEAERRRGTETENQSGRTKYQSLYPGVYVTTTVEGSYQNLRRFIRDIEVSNEFVIISSIELEPAENKEDDDNATTVTTINADGETVRRTVEANRGTTRGRTVSLRLELAAYFQRPNEMRITTSPVLDDNEPASDSVGTNTQ